MTGTQRRWAFERGTLWVLELSDETPSILPRCPATFGEVQRECVESLAIANGLPDPEPILRRLDTGRRCFVAWLAGQIAAFGWLTRGPEWVGELEREFHIQADEAYIWDCATLPAYRGQRLYSALLSHITTKLRGEGVRRVWIGASLDNQLSLRGFANAGFQPVVRLTYTRLFNLSCMWLTRYPTAPDPLVNAACRVLIAKHEHTVGFLVIGYSK